jgi:hypothetical protein
MAQHSMAVLSQELCFTTALGNCFTTALGNWLVVCACIDLQPLYVALGCAEVGNELLVLATV